MPAYLDVSSISRIHLRPHAHVKPLKLQTVKLNFKTWGACPWQCIELRFYSRCSSLWLSSATTKSLGVDISRPGTLRGVGGAAPNQIVCSAAVHLKIPVMTTSRQSVVRYKRSEAKQRLRRSGNLDSLLCLVKRTCDRRSASQFPTRQGPSNKCFQRILDIIKRDAALLRSTMDCPTILRKICKRRSSWGTLLGDSTTPTDSFPTRLPDMNSSIRLANPVAPSGLS